MFKLRNFSLHFDISYTHVELVPANEFNNSNVENSALETENQVYKPPQSARPIGVVKYRSDLSTQSIVQKERVQSDR